MTSRFSPSSPSYPGRTAVVDALNVRIIEAETHVAFWSQEHANWADKESADALYRAEHTLAVMKRRLSQVLHYPVAPSPEVTALLNTRGEA